MITKRDDLPTKAYFVERVLHLPLEECIVRRGYCPLVYREDHERYCYAGDTPQRIIDMVVCPIKISRRSQNDSTATV